MTYRTLWLIVGVGLGFALLSGQSCAPPPASDGGNGDDNVMTVRMRNIAFSPPSITISAGQTVRWVNEDQLLHTVTSGNPGDADAGSIFDSGTIPAGGTFEHTFNSPGTFVYFCGFHPLDMRDATVIVQ